MELPESVWNTLHPDSRFVRRYSLSGPTRTVPVDTLDRYCAEHHIDRIDLLKIDTEGSDLDVLRGASALLARRAVRFVYIEFNDLLADPEAHGGTLADFELLLRPFGFRYITTYTESIHPVRPIFLVANALFALEPAPAA